MIGVVAAGRWGRCLRRRRRRRGRGSPRQRRGWCGIGSRFLLGQVPVTRMHRVPPGGAVGCCRARRFGLGDAVADGRPHPKAVLARSGVPGDVALDPRLGAGDRAEFGRLPRSFVDRDSRRSRMVGGAIAGVVLGHGVRAFGARAARMETRRRSLRTDSRAVTRSSRLTRGSWLGRSLRRRMIRSRLCCYRVSRTGCANGGTRPHMRSIGYLSGESPPSKATTTGSCTERRAQLWSDQAPAGLPGSVSGRSPALRAARTRLGPLAGDRPRASATVAVGFGLWKATASR